MKVVIKIAPIAFLLSAAFLMFNLLREHRALHTQYEQLEKDRTVEFLTGIACGAQATFDHITELQRSHPGEHMAPLISEKWIVARAIQLRNNNFTNLPALEVTSITQTPDK